MEQDIIRNIKKSLSEIEETKKVNILYAIESGSRGWGFASADSDYDCRFIYVQELDAYLSIREMKDHIEIPVDEVYDVCGWDLKKVLLHIRKSNPVVWEWLQSPIIYQGENDFKEQCLELATLYFDEKAALYHYKSLACKKLEQIHQGSQGKLKGYFYALRSTLACAYMMAYHKIPPMELGKLMEDLTLEKTLIEEIKRLVQVKRTVDESYVIEPNNLLIGYMEKVIATCDSYISTLSKKEGVGERPLDECLRYWIKAKEGKQDE